jgi:hypothetical protein
MLNTRLRVGSEQSAAPMNLMEKARSGCTAGFEVRLLTYNLGQRRQIGWAHLLGIL